MTPVPPEPQLNPYRPPQAALEVQAPSTWLQEPAPPRPIAVWLLSLLLLVCGCVFTFAVLSFIWGVMTHLSGLQNYGALVVAVGWRVVFVAGLVAVLLGVFCGRRWARWPGVLMLLGIALYSVLKPDKAPVTGEAGREASMIGRFIFLPLLMAWWVWAFGFSEKAKRFFRVSGSAAP